MFLCSWFVLSVSAISSKMLINVNIHLKCPILCGSGRTQKQLLECMGSGEKKTSHFDRWGQIWQAGCSMQLCLELHRFQFVTLMDKIGLGFLVFEVTDGQRRH